MPPDWTGRIAVAGRLDAARWGAPPPGFLLLHEGLGSVGLWRDFPARLAAASGRGVFAWSRAWHGRSDPVALPRPLDAMRTEALEGVSPVLEAAGAARCVLVGHSDGATIAALHGALRCDPRVAGLVLIAPHYFVEAMCLEAIRAARTAYQAGDLRARLARHHDHVDIAFRGWNDTWLASGFRDFDIRAALPAIAVPVLQIQGRDDPYGTLAQTAAGEAGMARVRTLLLPARHAPHLEAAEATLAAIAGFARDVLDGAL